jgi:PH (Pleckstrin Homology) domain-containing protein
MLVTSLLNTDVAIMPLSKITDMRMYQTTFGRVLGYAHFFVESAGQDQALSRIEYVPFPSLIYRQILSLLFEKKGAGAGPPGAPGSPPGPAGPQPQEPPEPSGNDPGD